MLGKVVCLGWAVVVSSLAQNKLTNYGKDMSGVLKLADARRRPFQRQAALRPNSSRSLLSVVVRQSPTLTR